MFKKEADFPLIKNGAHNDAHGVPMDSQSSEKTILNLVL